MSATAALLMGLAAGPHCVLMCGGIVSAFAGTRVVVSGAGCGAVAANGAAAMIAFNGGRIASYAAAGAAAGSLGGAGAYFVGIGSWQLVLGLLANLLLVVAGLSLLGHGRPMAKLESLGAGLWRRIQPHAGRALQARSRSASLAAGALWGWLPCGLVYTALANAGLSGGGASGALAMAAFGLGTLPWLAAAGLGATRIGMLAAKRPVRAAAGLFLAASGAWGLWRSAWMQQGLRELLQLCAG